MIETMCEKKVKLYEQYKMLIKYIVITGAVAVVETIIGYSLKEFCSMSIVYANTISIIIGYVIHYIAISKKVFYSEINKYTVLAYLITFIVGTVLQNAVLKICYEAMLLLEWYDGIKYTFSKFVSLVLPFGITYQLRKWLLTKCRYN